LTRVGTGYPPRGTRKQRSHPNKWQPAQHARLKWFICRIYPSALVDKFFRIGETKDHSPSEMANDQWPAEMTKEW